MKPIINFSYVIHSVFHGRVDVQTEMQTNDKHALDFK